MNSRGMYRFTLPKTPGYRLEKQTVGEKPLVKRLPLQFVSVFGIIGENSRRQV